MIQPQWPGLGPSYQLPTWGGAPGTGFSSAAAPQPADGISPGWWEPAPGGFGAPPTGGSPATLWGLFQSILGLLGQLLGTLAGSGAGANPWPPGSAPNAPCEQQFSDLTLSSTGDPHLAETGTRRTATGQQPVDEHFDSMTSHADLIDARSAAGGYRVSTTVTAPDARGVTSNQSATVHANCGRDAVTMNRDGTFAVTSDGRTLPLAAGQSLTLDGGETVTANADGSLVVAAVNGSGGTISTTLRAAGSGVDVTAHAQQIGVGGDIVDHGVSGSWGAPKHFQPVRDALQR